MDSSTLPAYLSVLLLILIGVYGVVKSFNEYRWHSPPVKKFARILLVSFFLFGILGGLGVFLTVAVNPELWILEAIFITVGYLILAHSSLDLLEKLEGYSQRRMVRQKSRSSAARKLGLPAAGMVTSEKDAKTLLNMLFRYLNVPILAAGREHPEKWAEEMGIIPREYIWITRVNHPMAVSPSNLHVLNAKITSFLKENPGGVVYLEGVEYILFYVDFKALAKFILSIRDTAIVYGGHFILSVVPDTLEPSQLAIFKKEMPTINVSEALDRIGGTALFGALPPRSRIKGTESSGNARGEGPKEESGAGKEEAEEAGPLRREEAAEERR